MVSLSCAIKIGIVRVVILRLPLWIYVKDSNFLEFLRGLWEVVVLIINDDVFCFAFC